MSCYCILYDCVRDLWFEAMSVMGMMKTCISSIIRQNESNEYITTYPHYVRPTTASFVCIVLCVVLRILCEMCLMINDPCTTPTHQCTSKTTYACIAMPLQSGVVLQCILSRNQYIGHMSDKRSPRIIWKIYIYVHYVNWWECCVFFCLCGERFRMQCFVWQYHLWYVDDNIFYDGALGDKRVFVCVTGAWL